MDPIAVLAWAIVAGSVVLAVAIVVAVVAWTNRAYTAAVAARQTAEASRDATARSLRDAETEVTWLRAQLAGAGLPVGMPPAGDRTRRLVRATEDGVIVVQEGKP